MTTSLLAQIMRSPSSFVVHLSVLLLASIPVTLLGEETVVVNPSVTAKSLTDDVLKDIYLGKTSIWADGTKITVVVMKPGPSNEALMKKLNKSPQQFLSSWKKLVFTGKGAMPEIVADDQAMVDFIAKTPGAIGYIAKDKMKEGVKELPLQ